MNEEKMIKYAATASLILMLCVLAVSTEIPWTKESMSYASETALNQDSRGKPTNLPTLAPTKAAFMEANAVKLYDMPYGVEKTLVDRLGGSFIAIEKPISRKEEITFGFEEEAVDRKISVFIEGLTIEYMDYDKLHFVFDQSYHKGQALDLLESPSVTISDKGDLNLEDERNPRLFDYISSVAIDNFEESGLAAIEFQLSKTYAYILEEDEHYFFISMHRPQDIYDKIVVLDAGHGGKDTGTFSTGNVYLEKTMNLDILLRLQEYLLQHDNIKVYTTRTTDRRLTLNQRVNLANDVEADLFLSIHCNANLSSNIHGTEVLYNEMQNSWDGFNSKEFALLCQEEIVKKIGLKDRGIVPRSKDVYVHGATDMPVALVEVAFMSNEGDLKVLIDVGNRQLVAEGLYQSIMKSLE